jgi:hypothetical protein
MARISAPYSVTQRVLPDLILSSAIEMRSNAGAERVIGTLRRECLDHFDRVHERDLLQVLRG